jgi:hypothetical protein
MSPQTFDGACSDNSFASDAPPSNTTSIRSLVPRSILLTTESSLNAISVCSLNWRNMLPTPEPSLTPATVRSLSATPDVEVSTEQGTQLSYTPTTRRRCRSHSEGADDDTLLHPAAKRHKATSYARNLEGEPESGRNPPDNAHVPIPAPAVPDPDCRRGGRRLRINVGIASLDHDPLCPEEGDDEGRVREDERDDDNDGDVELDGVIHERRGLWRRRTSNDPRISSSDHVATIIAELASAHYRSSIYDPITWLRDIAGHVQTPYVDDESLLSVVARCGGITSRNVHTNFLLMVHYMTLVCKCQRCLPFFDQLLLN